MDRLSAVYQALRNFFPGLMITLILLLASGCKKDQTTTSTPGGEMFLQNSEFGLYTGEAKLMVYQKYEHQISKHADGKTFRLQTDNQSQLVSCTFSADPALNKTVEVTLRTIGISAVANATSVFAVVRQEKGKCWLWNEANQIGIIIPAK